MQWIPVGTDVTGRASALQTNRADATLLTAPNYFRLEEAGYKNLANLAEHEVYAATIYMFAKSAIAANPKLPEQIIKAHAEAIKRFYDDKAFAVKTYIAYDKQPEADVARIYDVYAKGNIFDRVPYVMDGGGEGDRRAAGGSAAVRGSQGLRLPQGDRQRHRRAPGQGRLLPEALRPRHQGRGVAQGLAGLQIDVRLKPDTTCVTTPRMHKLEIDGLTKRYYVERDGRQVLALSDVSLSVADGEFMAIVGPSGCGKTTLLNIVAGLLRYDVGNVIIDGARIDGPGVDRAVVFQQSSLLPWRTIAGNVRYGMEMQKRFDRATMQTGPSTSRSWSASPGSSGTIRRSSPAACSSA